MLAKEGHKGSYILFGITQIMLALAFGFLLLPEVLGAFGIHIEIWENIINSTIMQSVSNYAIALYNLVIIIIFLITFLSMFSKNSGSSFFMKVSAVLAIFLFLCPAIDFFANNIFGTTLNFAKVTTIQPLVFALLIASGICFVLGLLFKVVNKDNPRKANTFMGAKAFFWIILALLNFVIRDGITEHTILNSLFGYTTTVGIPHFFVWYFIVMGIWQLFSSPCLINETDDQFSVGTPYGPYYQQPGYPQAPYPPYPPVYPQAPAYPPYPPVYPTGKRQGLSAEENEGILPAENTIEEQPAEQQTVEEQPATKINRKKPKVTAQDVFVHEQEDTINNVLPQNLPPKLQEKKDAMDKQETAQDVNEAPQKTPEEVKENTEVKTEEKPAKKTTRKTKKSAE